MSGPLKNQRHEAFARELAKGKSADEAYQAAGFTANRGNACRLKANENIEKRVAELTGRAAERVEVTVASLILEAEKARQLAMRLDQPSAAVAAIKEKGVLSGVRVEKRENRGLSSVLEELSDEELEAILAKIKEIELAEVAETERRQAKSETEPSRRFN